MINLILALTFLFTPSSAPVGYLVIPSIDFYNPVYHTEFDLTELGLRVAHLEGTSWDDPNWGRAVIVGHTPGKFAELINVGYGDSIILLTETGTYEYVVFNIHIAEVSEIEWLMPTEHPTLTLITCYEETRRLIIEASLINYVRK